MAGKIYLEGADNARDLERWLGTQQSAVIKEIFNPQQPFIRNHITGQKLLENEYHLQRFWI